ncbi:MAG: NAD(P)-dependent oxidoreductase [Bryobacteraceae bacterium]
MRIGFIGLGVMGRPMAGNLIEAGHHLTVYDRNREKRVVGVALGARDASSSREVAAASEMVITMVSDTPDVEAVVFGPDGVAAGLAPGGVVVDMSTISSTATVEFARRLAAQGSDWVDAPVSGGEPAAISAKLSIMAGGRKAAFDRALPVLQTLGSTVVYTGVAGNGQKTKMVNQVIGSLNLLGVVEGLRLAKAAGLDVEATLQAVSQGAAGSWMLSNLGPRILKNDFAPGFRIRLHQKDLRLAKELTQSLSMDCPGSALAYELFTRALESGLGEDGNQGLWQLWEKA